MKYIDKQQLEDKWAKEQAEYNKLMKFISENPDKREEVLEQHLQNALEQIKTRTDSDSQGLSEYGKYNESIWPKLSEGVKNISYMHDAEIIDAKMVGNNFCIKFNAKAVEFDESYLTSVDLTDIEPDIYLDCGKEYEAYYMSGLTFINANVIKNDFILKGRPQARTTWNTDEIYLTPSGGYELHILATRHASNNIESGKLDDIILTFDDVIISVVGKH